MAQRRMTSLEVIDTDAFLDMPVSSQLLYFHLNARADDDGFVANPKKIMRMLNAGVDDFKMLIVKKFLISFEDGVCVIKHWRINNFIRKDIYKETKYLDLKSTLFIRPNGAYTLTDNGRAVALPSGHFQLENVNDTLTTRQPRLGKDRLGKVTSELKNSQEEFIPTNEEGEDKAPRKNPEKFKEADIREVFGLFGEDSYSLNRRNVTQRNAVKSLIEVKGLDKIKKAMFFAAKHKNDEFCPQVNSPHQLLNKWVDLLNYKKKYGV